LQALRHGTKNAEMMDIDPDLGGDANHAPGQRMVAAHRGWISENSPSSEREECFLLTSPFIEPATLSPG
jgi:hypothetical protein